MRKSLWMILSVLCVATAAPKAHADTIYTFIGASSYTGTVFTLDVGAPLSYGSTNLTPDLSAPADLVLSGTNVGTITLLQFIDPTDVIINTATVLADDVFASGYSLTPPSVSTDVFGGTLTVASSPVATPEPSSVALMLTGIGFLLVMRKRIGQGLPDAS